MHRFKTTAVCFVSLLFPFSALASGWTGYGKISELNQQPSGQADVVIIGSFPGNPTSCAVTDRFLLDVTSAREERMFAMLLAAFTAGREVRLFVTDGCPVWDTPRVTGVYLR